MLSARFQSSLST